MKIDDEAKIDTHYIRARQEHDRDMLCGVGHEEIIALLQEHGIGPYRSRMEVRWYDDEDIVATLPLGTPLGKGFEVQEYRFIQPRHAADKFTLRFARKPHDRTIDATLSFDGNRERARSYADAFTGIIATLRERLTAEYEEERRIEEERRRELLAGSIYGPDDFGGSDF